MATLKGQTIAASYQDLVKRADTYSQTGTNIELMDDSGDVQATGLYLESGAVTDNVGIGTATPDTNLHIEKSSGADPMLLLYNPGTSADNSYMLFATGDTGKTLGSDGFQIGMAADTNAYILQRESSDMIFSTSDTERMRIDSSGNVGIGTASPSEELHVKNSSSDHTTVIIDGGAASKVANLEFREAGNVKWDISSRNGLDNDKLIIRNDGSTAALTIDNSNDVTFAGDLIMADGKGINFAAMTSPADATNMAAETLKDYEEGTWTAAIAASDSGTITIANATGYYTKIGNQVFFKGRFTVGSISAPSGDLSITGLPFTSANPAGDAANTVGAVYFENSVNELSSNIIGLVPDNSTSCIIRRSGATGSGNDLADDVDAGTVLLVSGNYWT